MFLTVYRGGKIVGEHSSVGSFDCGMFLQGGQQGTVYRTGIVRADNGNVRRPGAERLDGVFHKVHGGGEGQKEDDTQRKGTDHQQKILAACHGMVYAQRRIHFTEGGTGGSAHGCGPDGTAGYCRQRRDSGSFSGRRAGGQQYGQDTDDYTRDYAGQADCKGRHIGKIHRTQGAKNGAQNPDDDHAGRDAGGHGAGAQGNRFSVYKPHDLFRCGTHTAQHTEKLCPPGDVAV